MPMIAVGNGQSAKVISYDAMIWCHMRKKCDLRTVNLQISSWDVNGGSDRTCHHGLLKLLISTIEVIRTDDHWMSSASAAATTAAAASSLALGHVGQPGKVKVLLEESGRLPRFDEPNFVQFLCHVNRNRNLRRIEQKIQLVIAYCMWLLGWLNCNGLMIMIMRHCEIIKVNDDCEFYKAQRLRQRPAG